MISLLETEPVDLSPWADLRLEVRQFLDEAQRSSGSGPWVGSWDGFDRDFSRALGARGWVGMAIPKQYGGHERSVLERYVVLEELLAGGAPVSSHWIADRQSAPLLLRFGTEEQRAKYLPAIARGELCFAIGMSEPDSGSDLAALRSRATRVDGGWRLNGTKLWTTNAHLADYMIALCRSSPKDDDRHAGLSQFLVDLKSDDVTVRPVRNLAGEKHFNEVVFEDAFVPDDHVVGAIGNGWQQVLSELAFERSGPDRFLSCFRLLVELVRAIGAVPDRHTAIEVGGLVARLWSVRQMSVQIAGMLDRGETPAVEAAIVKDMGTTLEQHMPEVARLLTPAGGSRAALFESLLDYNILHAPSFSLRGGTREVLRGIIARGLGLR